MSMSAPSESAYLERDRELGAGRTVMAEMPVTIPNPPKRFKQQAPQEAIDEFWSKFTTKNPGKATTVIPQNQYIQKAVDSRLRDVQGKTTQASYEEAAVVCKAKVAKIVKECRRINQKYRDPHFDLELDLKWGMRDTLESLSNDARAVDGGRNDRNSSRHPGRGDRVGGGGGGGGSGIGGIDSPGSRFRPRSIKRVVDIFDAPKFYIDGPTANDVRQGRDGDCWLLAALCTLSNKPSLIERVCVARDEAVGVYGFVFHRDGEWISEIIDDKLFLTKPDFDESFLERMLWEDRERVNSEEQYRRAYQSGSGALYFAQCEHADETWLPLLEKAYAKAHGDYAAIEGGFTGEGIEDLTGGVTSELYTTDILDKEYFWKEELLKVNDEFLFGCNTDVWGAGRMGDRNGIVELHAYSVMRAVEIDGERLVLLKNPWGKFEWKGAWSDGSKEWTAEWLLKLNHRFGDDGAFWISYKDLLRKYQAFDRTRLFGPEWKVTSLWTTLSVPWTLDYHSTHFAFTLAKTGPVVLVLSQLDDRYYRGLEGQYRFGLNFRLHKVGQEDYVVRTISPYCQTRSVNVELELEAGEYAVLLKVNATRDHRDVLPIEEVVRRNARDRRDKLVAVGMSYDLAHSKGQVEETAEERRARRAAEQRRKVEQRDVLRREIVQDRSDDHYLKVKAWQRSRKRKAKAKAKAEAKKAAREAARAEKARERAEAEAESEVEDVAEDGDKGVAVEDDEEKPKADITDTTGASAYATPDTQEAKAGGAGVGADSKDPDELSTVNKNPQVNIVAPDEIPSTARNESPGGVSPRSGMPSDARATEAPEKPSDEPNVPEDKPDPKEAEVGSQPPAKAAEGDETIEKPSPSAELEGPPVEDAAAESGPKSSSTDLPPPVPELDVGREQQSLEDKDKDIDERDQVKDEHEHEDEHNSDSYPDDDDDDEISSLDSFDDISDRELDIRMADAAAARRPPPPPPLPPQPTRGGGGGQEDDEPDEFESDPWNAVVTLGLRVYHKVASEDDRDKEMVKLRVVRPNPHLPENKGEKKGGEEGGGSSSSEDEDGDAEDESGDKEGQEKKKDGEEGVKGKGKGKGADDKKDVITTDEPKSSQGLDVDDSSKDATLVGDQEQRRKSILSLIPPRPGE